ncbi:alpha-glucosidase/alpha-galactosidase, partial [bacterium]|nr:alpha-glucosidase/alpha-galactosidase [bacterium]
MAKKEIGGHYAHMNSTVSTVGLPGKGYRKIKIVHMGAGSGFAHSLSKDFMQMPDMPGGEIALVDIDAKRLDIMFHLIKALCQKFGKEKEWKITAYTDRRKALPGADYIVNSIEVSGVKCVRFDNDIPLQYGVSQCIGDTIGPGGLMKALRTVPVWMDILHDAEELCPNALVLNYTNPMNIMTLATLRYSKMKCVGLCHSVQ